MATQTRDRACSQPGARSCEQGDPSRQPLQCDDGMWRVQSRYAEDEHCDTTTGPSQGTCVKIEAGCIGRLPGQQFCDDAVVRVCSNGSSSVVRRCAERKHCVEKDGSALCQCAPGTIDSMGACVVATTCDVGRGGCDPLTECSMDGSTRVCSACPDGYAGGDGSHGCTPLLLGLSVQPGELTPALSAGITSYRIGLSLLRPKLTLVPKVPAGVQVDINGDRLNDSGGWSSEPFALGDHTVTLTLTAASGLNTRYELVVSRSGQQEATLQQNYPDLNDTFGFSVAMSGETLVVGATGEDGAVGGISGDETNNGATEAGAAYVFVREGRKWTQQAYLKADQPRTSDFFGASVAIDGDTVLVGATRAGDHTTDAGSLRYREGAVYIYQRQGKVWSQRGVVESGRNDIEWFGWAVAFDKDSILVGAPHDAEDGEASGAVYILARSEPFGLITKLHSPEPAPGRVFGWSMAIDGDSLLVGASQNTLSAQGPGMAFAFKRVGGSWVPQGKLAASTPSAGASFGWSIALQGDLAAIGAPHPGAPHAQMTTGVPHGDVHLFRRVSDTWTETTQLQASVPRDGDFFGVRVLLSDQTLLVSASGDTSSESGIDADPHNGNLSGAGAFYLYSTRNSDWVMSNFIKSTNTIRGALLADSAAISGDTIIVSAMHDNGAAVGSGRVYVFR